MPEKPKIFISYAREDAIKVREIYQFLKENGCAPWLDSEELLPGQNWRSEIEKAIKQSDFFLACLSNHSVSHEGYMQKKLKKGLAIFEEIPEGRIFLIPIRLEECPVPESLGDIQWCDWTASIAPKQLLKAIGKDYLFETKEILTEEVLEFRERKPVSNEIESTKPVKDKPVDATVRIPKRIKEEKKNTHSIIIPPKIEKEITIPLPGLTDGAKPLEMVLIPTGTFMMGSPETEKDRLDNEGPQHQVTITKPFNLGKYEVTQEQWQAVMDSNPSRFKGNNLPVESVSWNDCQTFIQKLNQMGQGTFRLPTEAEWEYACRAGTTTRFYWGDDKDYTQIGEYAWYNDNSGSKTHEVGLKKPNAFGLYDMSGNVYEWCEDWYGSYSPVSLNDPTVANNGAYRVGRGGNWFNSAGYCRSALRDGYYPDSARGSLGFRIALLRTN